MLLFKLQINHKFCDFSLHSLIHYPISDHTINNVTLDQVNISVMRLLQFLLQ